MTDLDVALRAVEHACGGEPAAVHHLLQRTLLRTGVNLRSPRPDQRANPLLVATVIDELTAIGVRT